MQQHLSTVHKLMAEIGCVVATLRVRIAPFCRPVSCTGLPLDMSCTADLYPQAEGAEQEALIDELRQELESRTGACQVHLLVFDGCC
jgi:hypothetical protein